MPWRKLQIHTRTTSLSLSRACNKEVLLYALPLLFLRLLRGCVKGSLFCTSHHFHARVCLSDCFPGIRKQKKRTHTRAELRIRAPRESRFDGAVALLLPQRRRRKIFFLFALATLLADLRLLDWIFQKRSIAVGTHAHSPPPVWGTTRKYRKNYCLSLTVQGKSFSSRKRV